MKIISGNLLLSITLLLSLKGVYGSQCCEKDQKFSYYSAKNSIFDSSQRKELKKREQKNIQKTPFSHDYNTPSEDLLSEAEDKKIPPRKKFNIVFNNFSNKLLNILETSSDIFLTDIKNFEALEKQLKRIGEEEISSFLDVKEK